MNNIALTQEEIWKNIPGFENLYQISNLGRIKSLKTKRILKVGLGAEGYYRCTLITEEKKMPYMIHRLVALSFIHNPENLPLVHHINHNKLDNRIENLEWVSRKDNSRLASENGRYIKEYIKKRKFITRLTNDMVPDYYFDNSILDNEVWIDIKDFEDCYQISSYGRIKSKDREISGKSRGGRSFVRYRKSQFIKPSFGRDTYLQVGLQDDGRIKKISLHQLVARHFIINPNKLPCVNHLDSNPMNNHVNNLEWSDCIGNNLHARTKGNWNERGERNCASKLKIDQVLEIRANTDKKSIGKLSREYNVTRKCISNIINRKTWKHI